MSFTEARDLEPGLSEGFDIVRDLARLVEESRSAEDYLRLLPASLAAHFRSPLAGLTYGMGTFEVQETHSDEFESCASWQGPLGGAILEAERERRAFARVFDLPAGGHVGLFVLPLQLDGIGTGGAVGILVSVPSKDLAEAVLSELRALVSLFEFGALAEWKRPDEPENRAPSSLGEEVHFLSKAAGYSGLHEFAFAVTNNLRTKVDCEQVTLSRVVRKRVKILSISGIDDPNPRTPGVLEMTQAQEECVDQRIPIFAQEMPEWDDGISSPYRLHAQWREATGGANVGSIPIRLEDEVIAVLSLRRPATQVFTQEEIDACHARVEPFARSIEMLRRGERGVLQVAQERFFTEFDALRSPGARTKKIALGVLVGALLLFLFGSMRVRRPVVAHVAAREVVHLTAPFQAPIAQVFTLEGAHVRKGDPLVQLDTRGLELELAELEAQRDSIRVEVDQHLAASNLVQADMALARERVAAAQVASVSRRIEEAMLRAPADGIILRGDVMTRTGDVVPQGEPLFEFVEHGSLQLELDVPEAYVDELEPGLVVHFAANAAPERAREGTIEVVGAGAEVRDGKNVFVSTAGFVGEEDLSWLRVGMEGVAKIHVGSRPVRSVAFERLFRVLHQSLWL